LSIEILIFSKSIRLWWWPQIFCSDDFLWHLWN